MFKDDLNPVSQLAALKSRLHAAKITVSITVETNDDALVKELREHLGGGRVITDEQRRLVISGDQASSLIALGCGLRGIYDHKQTSRTIRIPRSSS